MSATLIDLEGKIIERAERAEAEISQFSEQGLALRFVAENADTSRFTAKWDVWFHWNGTRWAEDRTLKAFSMAALVCRQVVLESDKKPNELLKAKTRAAVVSLAREDPLIAATHEQWDRDPWSIGSSGGTVDLRTGSLKVGDPSDYITKSMVATPEGECPLWLDTINEIFCHDKEQVAFLKRFAGYCLTGLTSEEKLLFTHGSGGAGQGTVWGTLLYCLGDYGTPLQVETLIQKRHPEHPTELAKLCGVRLAVASETDEQQRWNTARIKLLTGSDKLEARFMRQNFFKFDATHKLVISGNALPRFGKIDAAIRRRLLLWHFTRFFDKPDETLKMRLRAESGGILKWTIEGCLEWQRVGLKPPASILKHTADYLDGADDIAIFIDDRCEADPCAKTRGPEMYEAWSRWCQRNGVVLCSKKDFNRRFRQKFEGEQGAHRTWEWLKVRLVPVEEPF